MWQLLPRLNNGRGAPIEERRFGASGFVWGAFLTAFDFNAFHFISLEWIPSHTYSYSHSHSHSDSYSYSIWFLFLWLLFNFHLLDLRRHTKNTLANLCKCIFNRRWQLRRAAASRERLAQRPQKTLFPLFPLSPLRSVALLCDDRCLWGGNTHRRWRWCCCKFVDCACCASQDALLLRGRRRVPRKCGNAVDDTRSCVPPDMAL